MESIKNALLRLVRITGYELVRRTDDYHNLAVELSDEELDILRYVINENLTMTSPQRLIATLKACKYAVENDIAGDFVECGVWRGGNGILAKRVFERFGSKKSVYMFDTFAGMTEPTAEDVAAGSKKAAIETYKDLQKDTHNAWCFASIEDVRRNCEKAGVDMAGVHLIKGDVCETLDIEDNLPERISILRLDTDWYESTKKELEVLYPRLVKNGALIIDDYGYWEGARGAVEEYFDTLDYKPLLNVTDYTGRAAIKAR